ncbi:MAG TPA: M3 family metallopeptidase [Thermomicrobiales bacterium]|nr:M3 family metallopeptidase [Thermomicrobiales bacterium]
MEDSGVHPPRWDTTAIFPSLNAPELKNALTTLDAGMAALVELLSSAVEGREARDVARLFDRILIRFDDLLRLSWTVEAYLYGLLVVDSRDALAQRQWSAFAERRQRVRAIEARVTGWLGTLDSERLIATSERAASHAFLLRRAAADAARQMSAAEESLAAELAATGAVAWQKLHGDIWSQLRVEFEVGGESRAVSISEARSLAQHPERATRRAAHDGEQRAWQRSALQLAAALNGVKGHALTLSARRGWDSPLDAACVVSQIDRATLDAMLLAVNASLPDFHRYLRAKASAMDVARLAWHDLYAPVGEGRRIWTFEDARALILEAFAGFSDRLCDLASQAFEERWIDAEPRDGKQGGGLCLSFPDGTSRITVNYTPAFMGVRQLAHELGHAYHTRLLSEAGRSVWQWSRTPDTLAETAAIFCESLVREAALADARDDERVFMLDATLQNTCRFLVEGMASFVFEQRMLEIRRTRELSVAELNGLALECQLETFGDALDPASLPPFMWASRPHAFVPETSHAAIPYMFGQLLAIGLNDRYQTRPDTFPAELDPLLASASTADIPTLAAIVGIDLRDDAFWQASVALIRQDVDQFQTLIDRVDTVSTS